MDAKLSAVACAAVVKALVVLKRKILVTAKQAAAVGRNVRTPYNERRLTESIGFRYGFRTNTAKVSAGAACCAPKRWFGKRRARRSPSPRASSDDSDATILWRGRWAVVRSPILQQLAAEEQQPDRRRDNPGPTTRQSWRRFGSASHAKRSTFLQVRACPARSRQSKYSPRHRYPCRDSSIVRGRYRVRGRL